MGELPARFVHPLSSLLLSGLSSRRVSGVATLLALADMMASAPMA